MINYIREHINVSVSPRIGHTFYSECDSKEVREHVDVDATIGGDGFRLHCGKDCIYFESTKETPRHYFSIVAEGLDDSSFTLMNSGGCLLGNKWSPESSPCNLFLYAVVGSKKYNVELMVEKGHISMIRLIEEPVFCDEGGTA